jgi:hypothetical protein
MRKELQFPASGFYPVMVSVWNIKEHLGPTKMPEFLHQPKNY